MKFSLLFLFCSISFLQNIYTQSLVWTGNAQNHDFFDENNWLDPQNEAPPLQGSIDPAQPINLNLEFSCEAVADGIINLGAGSLLIENGELSAEKMENGSLILLENSYLNLDENEPFFNNIEINFEHSLSWIKTTNITPSEFQNEYLNQIFFNQNPADYPENIRLDNYYSYGTVIRPNDETATPLSLFAEENLIGNSAEIIIDEIQNGDEIPNDLNNKSQSFLLKKGYMATLAVNEDGTGFSQVFIASEKDLVVNELPSELKNDISFIRVLPWNWVEKRGTGGDIAGMDNTWYYRWNNQGASDIDREYTPMSWGGGGADEDADIEIYKSKYKATHVLAFNEPDNCNGQSGQYGDLCIPDTAVAKFKNLMKTGLRLVSPSCREQAWDDWLLEFYDKATAQNIRIDVIAVHWYDWAGNPVNTPNANPQNIFNRFKTYLQNVYNLFGLPLWITEFNANKNRTTAVNLAFMELALPYLDDLDYVERYAWFQPNSGVADYFDDMGNLTAVGDYYKSQTQSPSIPEPIWNGKNNLFSNSLGEISPAFCPLDPVMAAEDFSISNEPSFDLFPNPTADILKFQGIEKPENVLIFDTNGRVVRSKMKCTFLEVSDLEKGVYFVSIQGVLLRFLKI